MTTDRFGWLRVLAYLCLLFLGMLSVSAQAQTHSFCPTDGVCTWPGAQTFAQRDGVYQVHPADSSGAIDTAANAKLALCGTSPCSTEAAPGSYTATGPITFQYDRQNFRCVGGPQGTVITFNPASSASLFVIHKADNTAATQNQLFGCSMTGSGSQAKTALEIYGGTSSTVTDFAAINLTEAGSKGVVFRGHQFIHLLRPTITNTSNPIWVSADTTSNAGGIDNDFTLIQHATLGLPPADTTHFGVTFDQDLAVFNFKMQQFDIAGGNQGIHWPADSAGGKPVALGSSFQDGRCEQMLGTTPWCADIEKPHVGLMFSNINVGTGINGFKFRNTKWVSLRDIRVQDGTKISLDVDGTSGAVQHLVLSNFFDAVGATRNLTHMVKIASGPTFNQAGPSDAIYENDSAADQMFYVGQDLMIEKSTGCIYFGGKTASFVRLCPNAGTALIAQLADGSAQADMYASIWHTSPTNNNTLSDGNGLITKRVAMNNTNTLLISSTAPTISSGFGTSPTIASNNGTAAFTVNVGTGGTASSGIIGLPTATTGWNCFANNITASAGHRADNTRQTASSTTSATIENQTISTGAALAWTASDIVRVSCFAY